MGLEEADMFKQKILIYLVIKSRISRAKNKMQGLLELKIMWGLCESFITNFFFLLKHDFNVTTSTLPFIFISLFPLTHIILSERRSRGSRVLAVLPGKHNNAEQGVFVCVCVSVCLWLRQNRLALDGAFLAFD